MYSTPLPGRHFCLKCDCTAAQAKLPPEDRPSKPTLRSLDTLAADLSRFTDAGADLDHAKDYNNVIGPAFFDIPLDQVRVRKGICKTDAHTLIIPAYYQT